MNATLQQLFAWVSPRPLAHSVARDVERPLNGKLQAAIVDGYCLVIHSRTKWRVEITRDSLIEVGMLAHPRVMRLWEGWWWRHYSLLVLPGWAGG